MLMDINKFWIGSNACLQSKTMLHVYGKHTASIPISQISFDTLTHDSPTVSGEEAMNSRLGVVQNITLFQIESKSCESENVFLCI